MRTKVEDVNSYTKKIKVELTAEDLAPVEKQVVRDYQKSVQIPGFRKGHAPPNMVKMRFADKIQKDLIDESLQKFYYQIFDETKITPVSQGNIKDFHFDKVETGMTFNMEVEVEPEFELKKYKGIQVEKDVFEVTDKMVEDYLQNLRENYATVKEVKTAKANDYLYFEAQELDQTNLPIIGHKYENLEVQIGSGKFDPEIEKQLVGMKVGEKRIVKSETPAAPESGKQEPTESRLEILAKKIEEKDFPELDDDFVKNLNDDSLENLEDLRKKARHILEHELDHRSEHNFQHRLVDELLKENPFDVPPSMVENYLNNMISDFKQRSQGQTVNEEAIRKEYRASTIHNLRWYFLEKKIVEAENIEVTEGEIDDLINSQDAEEEIIKKTLKDQKTRDRIKEDLTEKKVLDLIRENAKIVEVFPQTQPKIETE